MAYFFKFLKNLFSADKKLTGHKDTAYKKDFTPNKIIENDNALNVIIPDFEERKQKVTQELTDRLGKALPNDVTWALLQELYSESFFQNHKLLLNVQYQRGLLLQKEKKYKQALNHYGYGLYYLMNFYQADFNPVAHIIDQVETENALIEMAQQKFVNKIQLCIEYKESEDDTEQDIMFIVNMSKLPNIVPKDFLNMIKDHLKPRPKFDSKVEIGSPTFTNEHNLFEGLEFKAQLDFRTPLSVLLHHDELFTKENEEAPIYVTEAWQGLWFLKLKSKYDLGSDDDTCSSDIGALNKKEQQQYLDYLIKFHTIEEKDIGIEDKILEIEFLFKKDKNFQYYFKNHFGSIKHLDSHFGLLISNVVASNIAQALEKEGYRKLTDLKGVDSKELLKIKGVGKNSIQKLEMYF